MYLFLFYFQAIFNDRTNAISVDKHEIYCSHKIIFRFLQSIASFSVVFLDYHKIARNNDYRTKENYLFDKMATSEHWTNVDKLQIEWKYNWFFLTIGNWQFVFLFCCYCLDRNCPKYFRNKIKRIHNTQSCSFLSILSFPMKTSRCINYIWRIDQKQYNIQT